MPHLACFLILLLGSHGIVFSLLQLQLLKALFFLGAMAVMLFIMARSDELK